MDVVLALRGSNLCKRKYIETPMLFFSIKVSEMTFRTILQYRKSPTSILIYKPRLLNEGGLNMTVAYPMNFFFQTNLSLAQT